jgi:hypothetical protein
MNRKIQSSWRKWWAFYHARIQEYIFLLTWVLLFWAWERYVEQWFPLHGTPKLMLSMFESFYVIATTWELFILVFQIPERSIKNLFLYFSNLIQPPHSLPFSSPDLKRGFSRADIVSALG